MNNVVIGTVGFYFGMREYPPGFVFFAVIHLSIVFYGRYVSGDPGLRRLMSDHQWLHTSALSLVSNAILYWSTSRISKIVEGLREKGEVDAAPAFHSYSLTRLPSSISLSTNLGWLFGAAFAPLIALSLTVWFGIEYAGYYLLSGAVATLIALFISQLMPSYAD